MSIPALGPFGFANFSDVDWRTPANPEGFHAEFLADPDAFGEKLIRCALNGPAKVIVCMNVEGQKHDHPVSFVGRFRVAPKWVRAWLRRFAARLRQVGLKLMFLTRHSAPAEFNGEGLRIWPGIDAIADVMVQEYQDHRWFFGEDEPVLAGFHWDDNRIPEADGSGRERDTIPAEIVSEISERVYSASGRRPLITLECYAEGCDEIENVLPCRWGDDAPSRPFRELVMPTDTLKPPTGQLRWKRVQDFKSGDECAFPLYDSPVADEVLAAWRAVKR